MSALEVFDSFEKVVKAAEEENSGCSLVKTMRHIALSPKYIGRLRTGVHEILDAELGRFVKRYMCNLHFRLNFVNLLCILKY